MKRVMSRIAAAAVGLAVVGAPSAVAAPDAAVTAALAKGAAFLLSRQAADGHFSDAQMPALTALPLWALTGVDAPGGTASVPSAADATERVPPRPPPNGT